MQCPTNPAEYHNNAQEINCVDSSVKLPYCSRRATMGCLSRINPTEAGIARNRIPLRLAASEWRRSSILFRAYSAYKVGKAAIATD